MKISICLTTYKKLDYLIATLEDLRRKTTLPYELVISDDCSGDSVEDYLKNEVPKMFSNSKILLSPVNQGCSASLDRSFINASGDYLIHLDPDITLEPEGWYVKMAEFLKEHEDVGIVGPDYPMHHLRLPIEESFDVVDYCMGGIWSIRADVFKKARNFLGNGLWDKNLSLGQVEMDANYRVRMLGYRTALMKELTWKHLAPNYDWQGHKGVIEFLKKWNMYLLGFFHYKSPAMLIWDEFPLNRLLRKQIFSREMLNMNPPHKIIQYHDCELIVEPGASGSWREEEMMLLTLKDHKFRGCDEFENIPEDLWIGKVKWNLDIEEKLREKRNV